ncbi:MAG: sigma-54-dependent Fis family transcriptional regulator [Planctomycetes bacterium]|nr:sigma-54-dependent Fis family transcriptional regulator [Planctomycetota bacterium]
MSIDVEARRLVETHDVQSVAALLSDNAALREQLAELQARLTADVSYLRDEIKAERGLRSLSGDSAVMKAVRHAISQVAPTDSTVLIQGETGTGKELVARAIHQVSPRRQRLLVTVNCAALAPHLVASELFGHEAGAFTGAAKRRIGRFELAHQGTLFLDEIAEIPPELQTMLLRVLQEKTIERVGGNAPIAVDVRLIAATHQDLSQAEADGRFRADLFYRLNVFPIRIPPLRERREDIPDLVRHFLLHFGRRLNKSIERVAPSALALLSAYDWPGNVRELENLIERAMIIADGNVLNIDASWLAVSSPRIPNADGQSTSTLRDQERQAIIDALDACAGKIYGPDGAAARLGVKPTTLYGKMKRLGIRSPKNDAR